MDSLQISQQCLQFTLHPCEIAIGRAASNESVGHCVPDYRFSRTTRKRGLPLVATAVYLGQERSLSANMRIYALFGCGVHVVTLFLLYFPRWLRLRTGWLRLRKMSKRLYMLTGKTGDSSRGSGHSKPAVPRLF
jgi:hypothetical protein